MDLNKLSKEQLAVAEKIFIAAQKHGLNPDFVLPMVMQESGFNQSAVSKDKNKNPVAFGVMQITPATAKTYKCDDLNDMDQNINCGMRILADLSSKPNIGNDPYKVLAGYNAGPDTKFFTTGEIKDLPKETLNHMESVANHYGGELPDVLSGTQEETKTTEGVPDTAEPKEVPTGSAEVERNHWPEMLAGAGVGAKVAGSVESTRQAIPFVQNVLTRMAGNVPNPNATATRPSLQRYLNSQISPNLRMPLTELEKVTGGNKIRTMSEVQNALKAIQEVKSERVAKTASVDPKTGTPRQIFTQTEARPAVDLSKFEHTPTLATRATDELSRGAEFVRGALPSVARVGVGALGGALAGRQLYDAFDQYKKEGQGWNLHMPSARNASQIASGVGGALGTLPFGVTQAAGLALQAPEVIGQLNDADVAQNAQAVADYNRSMKNLPAQPTEQEIEQYRQMGPARNMRLGIRR
jgi:hypothetical protein